MKLRKWKYSDEDRDNMLPGCYDCGLYYDEGVGWVDVRIPNEWWERINPTYHEGAGLLCFNCIARRLTFIGAKDVPIEIASGPFEVGV